MENMPELINSVYQNLNKAWLHKSRSTCVVSNLSEEFMFGSAV
jgi:hypothetical protein